MRDRGGEEKDLQGAQLALVLEEGVDWESVWSYSSAGDALSASLRELRCKSTPPARVIWEFIFYSIQIGGRVHGHHSDGQRSSTSQSCIIAVLHTRDPSLFASSTPFVTGRPYTLIFNCSVKSSGAVSLALSACPSPVPQTCFPLLRAISAPLKKGNLISKLDNANPTEPLISAIVKSAAKDDEFYLGVLRDGEYADTAPGEDTSVQLFHRPMSNNTSPAAGVPNKNTLAYFASFQVGNDMAPFAKWGDNKGVVTVVATT
ncbi:hypothetical protein EI94DRAFT_1801326 [Lactarius quietus]|nr:hypothetical protein EI94DRAFT_1801326 [Lactarius quietus]